MASCMTFARVARFCGLGVLVHEPGQQFLVEGSPVRADAHRFVVFQRHLDDGGELPVPFVLEADIARIDAVFVERLGAGGVVGQQLVADIMKVADNRHVGAELPETVLDVRYGRGRRIAINGNAHQLGARCRQCGDLPRRAFDIGSVGFVMDWTTMGAPPPTVTPPTRTATDL